MRWLNKKYEAECAAKLNMMLNENQIWLDMRLNLKSNNKNKNNKQKKSKRNNTKPSMRLTE